MWIILQYFCFVTVVLGDIDVDNIYGNLGERNFLTRRAADGSRGSKHFNPEDDGFYENYNQNEDDPYQNDIRLNVPGEPGVDYPAYTRLPLTRFSCVGRARGYYADPDVGCQVFHVCHDVLVSSFLCPVGSIFNQQLLTCDWWNKVDCSTAGKFYHVNDNIYGQDDDEMMRKAHAMINLQLDNEVLKDPNRKSKVVNGSNKNEVNDGVSENLQNSQRQNQADRNPFNSNYYHTQESITDSPIIRIQQIHNGKLLDYPHNAGQNQNSHEQRIHIFQTDFENEFQPSYAPTVPTVTTTTKRLYSPTVPTTYRPFTESYGKFDQDVQSSEHLYTHGKDIRIYTTIPTVIYNKGNINKDNPEDGLKKNLQELKEDSAVAIKSIGLAHAGSKKIAQNRNRITKNFQNLGGTTHDELSTVPLDVTVSYKSNDFGTTVPSFDYKNVDSTTKAENITILKEGSHFSGNHPITTEFPKYVSQSTTNDIVETGSTRIPKFSMKNTTPTDTTRFHSESITYSNETPGLLYESGNDSSTAEEATTVGGIDFSGNHRFITQQPGEFSRKKFTTVSDKNFSTIKILNYTETPDISIQSTTPYNVFQENTSSDENDGSTEGPETVIKSIESLTTRNLPRQDKHFLAISNSRDNTRTPKREFNISPTTEKLNIYNTDIEYGSRIGRESGGREPADFLEPPELLGKNFRINVPDETSTQRSKLLAAFTTIEYRPYSMPSPLKNLIGSRITQDDSNKKTVKFSSLLNNNEDSKISFGLSSSEEYIEVPATTLIPPFDVSKYDNDKIENSAYLTTEDPSTSETEDSLNHNTETLPDLKIEDNASFTIAYTPSTEKPSVNSNLKTLEKTPSTTEENDFKTEIPKITFGKNILESTVQFAENIPATGTPIIVQDNFGKDFSLNLREIEDSIVKNDSPYQVSFRVNKDEEIDPTKDQSFIKSLIAQHESSNTGIFGDLGNFEIIRSDSPDSISPKQEKPFKVPEAPQESLREAKKVDFEKGNLDAETADSKTLIQEKTKGELLKSNKFPQPFSSSIKPDQQSQTKILPAISTSQQVSENPILKSSDIKNPEQNEKNQVLLRERILAELNKNFGQPAYKQEGLIFALPDKERYLDFKTGLPLIELNSDKIKTETNLPRETIVATTPTSILTPTLTKAIRTTSAPKTVKPKTVETVVETEFIPSLGFSFDSDEGRKEYVEAVLQGLLTNNKSFDPWSDNQNSPTDKEKKKAEVS
ncbi:uncharacterized protein LOC107264451 isoform X2 [Cephus cinctus]|uniref:Uncharacterized protein LOC107264451 isoform X2 n=1 Tax=Cephus cinctus TaxID=211228 RepID=A0AAJ7FES1_CEPCN|nr:uncharacterized protein LOC107264451 isoform X2 [Cephus cinctus]